MVLGRMLMPALALCLVFLSMEGAVSMVEMVVDSVRIEPATQRRFLILKAKDEDRYLSIWIAQPEAYAIAAHLQGTIPPRPLTHDLMKNLIEAMGTKVTRVIISNFKDEIYYAQIILGGTGEKMAIDARPSDAVALAVRTKTPVFVVEDVLEQRGTLLTEQVNTQLDPDDDACLSSIDPKEAKQKQMKEDPAAYEE